MLTVDQSMFTPAEEILKHPAFGTVVYQLEPTRKGTTQVAHGRRSGPIDIYWQMHGHGPIKVLLICGLLARHTAWQRQTLHFGHINASKYTLLICDNRGSGLSSKPFWYSTSEMALDLIEVLDHVGWTAARSVHVAGLSMGGMIAQELAMRIPQRVSTLNLAHTAARMENTLGQNLRGLLDILTPKTVDESIAALALAFFDHRWLLQPDDAQLPQAGMPGVQMPACGGEYRLFETNYHRYAAQELTRQAAGTMTGADKWAILGHFIASAYHAKSERQLRWMADRVGRERILVLHTKEDRMIPVIHGEKLMDMLDPGVALMMDGEGHVPKLEKAKWFNELLEESFANGERITRLEKGLNSDDDKPEKSDKW